MGGLGQGAHVYRGPFLSARLMPHATDATYALGSPESEHHQLCLRCRN